MIYVASFFSAFFFGILDNVRGKSLIAASLCGVLGLLVYNLTDSLNLIPQYMISTIVMSLYAEIFARVHKKPVTVYITIGILPIVPGLGVYNTIDSVLNSKMTEAYSYGIDTLLASGSMALGIILVISLVRYVKIKNRTVKRIYRMGKVLFKDEE